MREKKLGALELQFAEIVWDNAPISTTDLIHHL